MFSIIFDLLSEVGKFQQLKKLHLLQMLQFTIFLKYVKFAVGKSILFLIAAFVMAIQDTISHVHLALFDIMLD